MKTSSCFPAARMCPGLQRKCHRKIRKEEPRGISSNSVISRMNSNGIVRADSHAQNEFYWGYLMLLAVCRTDPGLLVAGKETNKVLPILRCSYSDTIYSMEGIDSLFPRRHNSD